MGKQQNYAYGDITLCGEVVSAQSPLSEVDVIDLTVTKNADCSYVLIGNNICYTLTYVNNSDVDFTTEDMGAIIVRDPLGSNVTFVDGSMTVDIDDAGPEPVVPIIDGATNVLTYDGLELEAGKTAIVVFCVTVNSMPAA